jgi:hypothetical protein
MSVRFMFCLLGETVFYPQRYNANYEGTEPLTLSGTNQRSSRAGPGDARRNREGRLSPDRSQLPQYLLGLTRFFKKLLASGKISRNLSSAK